MTPAPRGQAGTRSRRRCGHCWAGRRRGRPHAHRRRPSATSRHAALDWRWNRAVRAHHVECRDRLCRCCSSIPRRCPPCLARHTGWLRLGRYQSAPSWGHCGPRWCCSAPCRSCRPTDRCARPRRVRLSPTLPRSVVAKAGRSAAQASQRTLRRHARDEDNGMIQPVELRLPIQRAGGVLRRGMSRSDEAGVLGHSDGEAGDLEVR